MTKTAKFRGKKGNESPAKKVATRGSSADSIDAKMVSKLWKNFLAAALRSHSSGLYAYSFLNILRKHAASKAILSAPAPVQVAVAQIAIPMVSKPRPDESDCVASVLLSMLLRNSLQLPERDVIELLSTIAKRESLVYLSDKVLLGFLERWRKAASPSKNFLIALRAYASTLNLEYKRAENTRAKALIALCAASKSGHAGKGEVKPAPACASSPLEKAILTRESLSSKSSETLAQQLAASILQSAESGADASAIIPPVVGVDKVALQAVNECLRDALAGTGGNWEHHCKRGPGKLIAEPAGSAFAATTFSAVAALTQRGVRQKISSDHPERVHRGTELIFMLSIAGLKTLRTARADDLAAICEAISCCASMEYVYPDWEGIASEIARLAKSLVKDGASSRLLGALIRFRERIARTNDQAERAVVLKFDEFFAIGIDFPVDLGERWSDRMFLDVRAAKPSHRPALESLLNACATASGANPSAKWLKQTDEIVKSLPAGYLEGCLSNWLSLVGRSRQSMPGGKIEGRDSSVPSDRAADVLRGMAWTAAKFDTPRMARALGDLAMACYKMVPGVGARCIKPGTAAVWALSQLKTPEALSQLSRIRQLVKFGTAKKTLDLALNKLARQLNLSTDELHEIAAPDFGLEPDGTLHHEAGEFNIELRVGDSGASVRILDAAGKERASVPESVKRDYKPVLSELKQTAADIDKMLPAQKDRIERLFHDDRSWPMETWCGRYHDHPLVGTLARRLIWSFESSGKTRSALWHGKHWIDRTGSPFMPAQDSTVRLWHPINAEPAEVLAWRSLLEEKQIRQPFKQAHREIYVLTDAERRTADYSNRFAAHIIKQAQFNALCQQRGWKHTLFLLEYGEPAVLAIPRLGLAANFVVSAIGDESYGTTGAYSFLQTDQVAFIGEDGERVPLRTIPPLVFSEVMRDVDLFIGVCSVGLDPAWIDTGGHEFGNRYWREFSFGDLSETSKTRRDVLSRLIPRLKIAKVCELFEKFLKVKGKLRQYKIHLGSGNILMEPNDQYLCIVPSMRGDAAGDIHLPFDGDRMLSVILSKALMLAEDDRIKDASIVSQIGRGAN